MYVPFINEADRPENQPKVIFEKGQRVYVDGWENYACVVKNVDVTPKGVQYFCGISLEYDGGQWVSERSVTKRGR
jgi:hypothetical protein